MTSNPYRLLSWQELSKQLTCYWCSLVPLPLVSLTLFKSSNGKMKKRHCSIFDNIYCVFYGLEHEGNIPSLQQPACNYSCLWFYTHRLWTEMLWLGAMALAETELMFFAETRMMLWFGFLVTIVQQCLLNIKDFPASCAAPPARRLQVHRKFFRQVLGLLDMWNLVAMANNVSQSWNGNQPFEFSSELP